MYRLLEGLLSAMALAVVDPLASIPIVGRVETVEGQVEICPSCGTRATVEAATRRRRSSCRRSGVGTAGVAQAPVALPDSRRAGSDRGPSGHRRSPRRGSG